MIPMASARRCAVGPPINIDELLGNLPGMAYRCLNKPRWPLVFASDGVTQLTGYTPRELVQGGPIEYGDLIHPDDRQRVWDSVQAAIDENRPFRLEYRLLTKDGNTKWVLERGRAFPTGARGQESIEGFITEVTAIKQREEELAEANKAMQSRVRELKALNELFQQHLEERFTLIQTYQETLTTVHEMVERGSTLEQKLRKLPLPDLDNPVPELEG